MRILNRLISLVALLGILALGVTQLAPAGYDVFVRGGCVDGFNAAVKTYYADLEAAKSGDVATQVSLVLEAIEALSTSLRGLSCPLEAADEQAAAMADLEAVAAETKAFGEGTATLSSLSAAGRVSRESLEALAEALQ